MYSIVAAKRILYFWFVLSRSYIVYQLLCALQYLHSAGCVHRDVKPSNILLMADCSLKLGDFGMVRTMDDVPADESSAAKNNLTHYVGTCFQIA